MRNSPAANKSSTEIVSFVLDKATLFYDGQCPICLREMHWLNKFKAAGLQLINVHDMLSLSADERERLLRRLHLKQADGRWLMDMDASVAAWSYTPFGFLLRPLRWRLFARLVDHFYERWADKRYCRVYGCSLPPGTAGKY
ncbi:MAG TPA: DCC1-like thiol-disulfide oxidoreductase family protein [Cellvibrio sp.]|nr:DCC1-like thiol-disulfide oxidoreductase family protein [Cellvibrio sp.]